MRDMTRVLLAEDDSAISEPLARALRREGYEVEVREDGPGALESALSGPAIDLIVLDLGLPGMDGLEVCRRLRAEGHAVPVLVLTARADEVDTVAGLDAGADDYVTKPFRLAELLARARALLRRGGAEVAQGVQGVRIDTESHRAWVDERELSLTAKEFDLLLHFARNPGRVFSRMQLLDAVWGSAFEGYEHNVNTHINRLRAKIERDPAVPIYVLTVRGAGYRFSHPQ